MQHRERIATWQMIGLMSAAVCIDAVYVAIFMTGMIPIFGIPISWVAAMWFSVNVTSIFIGTFVLLGTTFISHRYLIRLMFFVIGKFIPIVSVLPLWTVYVYLTCRSTRKEDEEYNEEMRKKSKSVWRRREESEYEQQQFYAAQAQAANDNRLRSSMEGVRTAKAA